MASGEDEVVTPTDRSYIHDDLDDLDAPRESARKELMDDGPPGLPPFRARSLDAEMANAESASLEATAPSPPLYIHDVVFALRAPAPAPQSGAAPWAVPPAMPLMVKLIASSLALPMEAPAPPPTFTTDESAPPPLPPPLIVDDDDAAWLQCGHKYWLQAPSKKLGSYELYGAVRTRGGAEVFCADAINYNNLPFTVHGCVRTSNRVKLLICDPSTAFLVIVESVVPSKIPPAKKSLTTKTARKALDILRKDDMPKSAFGVAPYALIINDDAPSRQQPYMHQQQSTMQQPTMQQPAMQQPTVQIQQQQQQFVTPGAAAPARALAQQQQQQQQQLQPFRF